MRAVARHITTRARAHAPSRSVLCARVGPPWPPPPACSRSQPNASPGGVENGGRRVGRGEGAGFGVRERQRIGLRVTSGARAGGCGLRVPAVHLHLHRRANGLRVGDNRLDEHDAETHLPAATAPNGSAGSTRSRMQLCDLGTRCERAPLCSM
eukprot:4438202-Prymnesium_polylepis.3